MAGSLKFQIKVSALMGGYEWIIFVTFICCNDKLVVFIVVTRSQSLLPTCESYRMMIILDGECDLVVMCWMSSIDLKWKLIAVVKYQNLK